MRWNRDTGSCGANHKLALRGGADHFAGGKRLVATIVTIGTYFVLIGSLFASELTLKANRTEVAPDIDGVLEGVWQQADSAWQFVQLRPYEGRPLSEPTVVYFLEDSEALYIGFRCGTNGRAPDCPLSTREQGAGDLVSVYLDSFFDRRNAYRFSVSCGGVQGDAILSENGAITNTKWDGVFKSAAKVDSLGYCVEMAIPWSSLRFDDKLSTWGFNLERKIPRFDEVGYFAPILQSEGFTVSNFAHLENIHPTRSAKGIEFYPQTFFRTEKSYGDRSSEFQPAVDFNWAVNPSVRLQSTFNSDFAQVEADPYAVNLSKYALYFDERRPFFVEGQEYFQPSGSVMAQPLELFYSRQVGKKLPDGSEVPLQAGVRLIGKAKKLELGSLLCRTGRRAYEDFSGPAEEPSAVYTTDRLKYQPFTNTTVGLSYSAKLAGDFRNDVISLDGSTSTSRSEYTYQICRSNYDGLADWAVNSFFLHHTRNFLVRSGFQVIGDNFNVSEIGFVPWFGSRSFSISLSPSILPKSGVLSYGAARVGIAVSREFREKEYSRGFDLALEFALRNGWGVVLTGGVGKEFEAGADYNPKSFSVMLNTDVSRRFYFNGSYGSSFTYNYLRGFFARADNISLLSWLRVSPRFGALLSSSIWIEHRPQGGIEEVTYVFRPSLSYEPLKGMGLRLYEETPVTRSGGTKSVRLGASVSWNFLPKSWIIIAFNDYEWRRAVDGVFESQVRVFALKAKQLFAW